MFNYYIYSKDQLLKWMGAISNEKIKVTSAAKGPGAPNFWELVQNNNPACWSQRGVTEQPPEPTVILAGPYFLEQNHTNCLQFLDVLLSYGFKVIAWQGDTVAPKKMLVCDKVTTLLDHPRELITVADANSVMKHLMRHHCEVKNYFIVDLKLELELMDWWEDGYSNYADLDSSNLSLQTTRQGMGEGYRTELLTIDLQTINIEQFLEYFPLTTKIKINNCRSINKLKMVLDSLTCLSECTIGISCDLIPLLSVLGKNEIKNLTINRIFTGDKNAAVQLDLSAFAHCERLRLVFFHEFHVTHIPMKLHDFELNAGCNFDFNLVPTLLAEQIETLRISNYSGEVTQAHVANFKRLKKIITKQSNFKIASGLDIVIVQESDQSCFSVTDILHNTSVITKLEELTSSNGNLILSIRNEHLLTQLTKVHCEALVIDLYSKSNQVLIANYLNKLQLRHLSIHGMPDLYLIPELISAILKQKQLYTLFIRDVNFTNLCLEDLPNLCTLEIVSENGDESNNVTIKGAPNLRYICFNNITLPDDFFAQIDFPSLIYFKLANFRGKLIQLKNLSYLQTVDFHDVEFNPDSEVVIELESLPRLKIKYLPTTSEPEKVIASHQSNHEKNYLAGFSFDGNSFSITRNFNKNTLATHQSEVSCFIVNDQNQFMDASDIRQETYEQITYNSLEHSIQFIKNPPQFIQSPRFEIQNRQETLTVYLKVKWKKGAKLRIPTYREYEIVAQITSENGVVIDWYDFANGAWYLLPNDDSIDEIQDYCIVITKQDMIIHNQIVPSDMPLINLFSSLIYQSIAELSYLFDQTLSPLVRLNRFQEYFHSFTEDEFTRQPRNDLETLYLSLKEKKGNCQHISVLFLIVAKMLGFHGRLCENEMHVFPDIALFNDKNEYIWKTLNVSGYGQRQNPHWTMSAFQKSFLNKLHAKSLCQDRYYEPYRQLFNSQIYSGLIQSTEQLIENISKKNVLLLMNSNQNPMVIYQLMIQYFLQETIPLEKLIFINDPNEFSAFFTSQTIVGHTLTSHPGPLQHALQSESLIIVDWTSFSKEQLLEYLSLLDTKHANLNGVARIKQCRILGMTTAFDNLCDAFRTRCSFYHVDDVFYQQSVQHFPKLTAEIDPTKQKIKVNCFQDPIWQPEVFGAIGCQAGQLSFENSPLLNAIKTNGQLVVINPPDTREWQTWLSRVALRQCIYVNGQMIHPQLLSIATQVKINQKIPNNLHISSAQAIENFDQHCFILNSQTVNQLFANTVSDDDGLVTLSAGLLNENEITQLYLTSELDAASWNRLKAAIKSLSCVIKIILLPGAKLTEEYKNVSRLNELDYANKLPVTQVVVAEFPHIEAANIADELHQLQIKVLRIYVNHLTSYADLICDMQAAIANQQCLIQQNARTTLAALQDGFTILLIGALSPELFLQMQSAFIEPAHLWYDRQKIQFPGKFILITANFTMSFPACSKRFDQAPILRKRKANQVATSPITVLCGEPGVGKTHYLQTLQKNSNNQFFIGYESIIDWLSAPAINDVENVFVPDEMNTYPVGTWDFLYGLVDGTKQIFYKGNWYQGDQHLKVIGTMNPNHHPGRFVHPIIEGKATIIQMAYPSPADLLANVASPLISNIDLAQWAVTTHELARNSCPEVGFSIRDLKAFCHRLLLEDDLSHLQKAYLQYALPIYDNVKRNALVNKLEIHCNQTMPAPISQVKIINKIVITETRQSLLQIVYSNLQLRFLDANLKVHILCEGDSATGKTSLFIAVLKHLGFSKNHPDLQKRFYHVNARSQKCREKLMTAAQLGCALVLDEANSCICPEALNELLDGYLKVTKGFIVLASQNNNAKGRHVTGHALSSRYHRCYLENLAEKELIECATALNVASPNTFVSCYLKAHAQSEFAVNPRTFFNTIKFLQEEPIQFNDQPQP